MQGAKEPNPSIALMAILGTTLPKRVTINELTTVASVWTGAQFLKGKDLATAGRNVFTYSGEVTGLPSSDAPSILNRSYTITAEVDIPEGGGEGMIATEGGRFSGYGLYLLKGKPVFLYNLLDLERFRWEGQEALAPGKHTIEFDFTYEGPGFGKGGSGMLKVDDEEVDPEYLRLFVALRSLGRDRVALTDIQRLGQVQLVAVFQSDRLTLNCLHLPQISVAQLCSPVFF